MRLGYKLDLLACLFVPNPCHFSLLPLKEYKSKTCKEVCMGEWKRAESVSHENVCSLSSLVVEVSQIDDWLVFLKCFLFLERSDSFLAVFIFFIINALRWNLCLNGKASAEEIQPNGKSCCTMFQCESFLWLVVNVRDFFFPLAGEIGEVAYQTRLMILEFLEIHPRIKPEFVKFYCTWWDFVKFLNLKFVDLSSKIGTTAF